MNVQFCGRRNKLIKSYPLHTHNNWEIIYNLSGKVVSTIGDSTYNISENDVIVVPPNVPHDGVSKMYYSDMFIEAQFLDFHNIIVVHDYDNNIVVLMNMLQKIYIEKETNYDKITDYLLETIVQCIKKYAKERHIRDFTRSLKNTIFNNISNPEFNLTDTVNEMGYNSDYMRRCFREDFGKSPLEYLTQLRLEQAEKMLTWNSAPPIQKIALTCGYKDSFYFSKLFKKAYGVSPKQYQQKRKSTQEL